ncbi:hypothetical protein AAE028_23770 [Sinorhizobium sp. CB9]
MNAGHDKQFSSASATLFERFKIGSMLLSNRIVVSPMTRVCGTEDGRATQMADS